MNKSILLYLHIPKTAGTTINSILQKQYTEAEKLNYFSGSYEDFLDVLKENVQTNPKLKCVMGHYKFGIHDYIPEDCTYITLLRNPIERVLSTFYFIRRDRYHPFHKAAKKMSLKEFVLSEEIGAKYLVFNTQTTFLSNQFPPGPNSLEMAKRNIENHFNLVGITERFDESLFLMKREFGWEDINYMPRNVTRNRPCPQQHPMEVIEIIKSKNLFDIELYEHANYLLNIKINKLDNEVKQDLQKFLNRNSKKN
ncbi:sulfotransferase family 2 domain-containing protein [Cytobacillus firmus]|uniref:Sulfotransferase family 2 domain-containing protein n=1 Tax=Cytobacillus firmus TaxID=1399 RepID=A0AA46PYS2_CYTFI|nr:sulfotransferase family 2 domain-containing protein [Cytobacillus firmus]KML36101.1 hypothetical protein VL14_21810 [Cytobacillus firmus]MCS0652946.1 sulfotransferase family 2 domain-containing protein [Cytobacillus firmus]MCU1803818.1 sulfotransferase family 2 domain-containing protein [Cytobacillus firmus]UYG95800.1 sulfotransferase family 2 domain-containing protein [Cytobacillus firmus]WHY36521.1 sulfotransferase family 2 domain-containing protein [Cytobacillus firmus]